MNSDIIWQAFVDTGDPSFYLLYKTASDKEREEKTRKDPEERRIGAATD